MSDCRAIGDGGSLVGPGSLKILTPLDKQDIRLSNTLEERYAARDVASSFAERRHFIA